MPDNAFKLPEPPDRCDSLEGHERKTTQLANALDEQIANLLEPGKDGSVSPMVVSRAKELALAVCRLRKLAADLAQAREDRSYSTWLVGQYERLGGRKKAGRH